MARKPDRRIGGFVSNYFVEAMIGWGGSSKVYRVRHADTLQHLAMKVISKPKSKIGELEKTFAECAILASLDHPYIVKMYEWFQTEKKVFIFMELAHDGTGSTTSEIDTPQVVCDLLEFVNTRGTVPDGLMRKWFGQLVQALQYIHAKGLVHKDIKLDNVLLDGDRILLADWGYAHEWTPGYSCQRYAGTQGYWAPEVMAERPFEGPEVDCWSLGVTLYGMAIGRLPFNRENPTYYDDVMQGRYLVPSKLPSDLRTVIYGLMTVDPIARFNINDVMETDFYRSSGLPIVSSTSSSPLTPSLTPSVSPRPVGLPTTSAPAATPAAVQQPVSPSAHLTIPPTSPTRSTRTPSPEPASLTDSQSKQRTKSPAVKHQNVKLSELHLGESLSSYGALERSPREPPASEASTPTRSRANSTELGSPRSARRYSLPDEMFALQESRSFTPGTKPPTEQAAPKHGTAMQKFIALFKNSHNKVSEDKSSSKEDLHKEKKEKKDKKDKKEKDEKKDKYDKKKDKVTQAGEKEKKGSKRDK